MATMPMFPLGTVLMPTGILPLHVFEPRYRRLVEDCLAAPVPEFGVAMIERGSEVGGGDHRSRIATIARIVQGGQYPDGRYGLITIGTRRVQITEWLPDDPYPIADVVDWPDSAAGESVSERALSLVLSDVRRVAALAIELGEAQGDLDVELSDDATIASYQLANLAPFGASDRFALLAAPGPLKRVSLLRRFLAEREDSLRFQLLNGQRRSSGGLDPDDFPDEFGDEFGGDFNGGSDGGSDGDGDGGDAPDDGSGGAS